MFRTRAVRYCKSIQNGSGAHPAFYTMSTGAISPGVKRQGREADHSIKYRVQEWWTYTFTAQLCLYGGVCPRSCGNPLLGNSQTVTTASQPLQESVVLSPGRPLRQHPGVPEVATRASAWNDDEL
jgi:hypothetical protein